jgi:hypothetical protein
MMIVIFFFIELSMAAPGALTQLPVGEVRGSQRRECEACLKGCQGTRHICNVPVSPYKGRIHTNMTTCMGTRYLCKYCLEAGHEDLRYCEFCIEYHHEEAHGIVYEEATLGFF